LHSDAANGYSCKELSGPRLSAGFTQAMLPPTPSPVTLRAASLSSYYVCSDEYAALAGLHISGRTLLRRCQRNRHLAERLGYLRWSSRRIYLDARTAERFRKLYLEAEAAYRAEQADPLAPAGGA
jgi:hypothetical protein